MDILKYFFLIILWLVFFTFNLSSRAYAYLDPGTGSYLFQLVIGFFLGGIFVFKSNWKKVKKFLVKLLNKKGRNEKSY